MLDPFTARLTPQPKMIAAKEHKDRRVETATLCVLCVPSRQKFPRPAKTFMDSSTDERTADPKSYPWNPWSTHHLVHLLPQLEPGIGQEEFTPSATGLICGVSARAWPMLRRNCLLDKHSHVRYTIGANGKTAEFRLV
jgi:hypothetical protein